MGAAATIGTCLVGSTCQCLCSLFTVCGASPKIFSRIGYVLFAFLWIIFAVIFLFYGHYIFDLPFSGYLDCQEKDKQACIGISAVFRTSFTLVLFHLLLCLLCTCKGPLISKINEGAWPVKFVVVLIIFILSFFIPNGFFRGYGYLAMGGGFLFLVYEMVLIVDMAYSWNSAWVSNYESNQSCCSVTTIILGTLIATGLGITIYVLLFSNLAHTTGDYIAITLPIIAAVIYVTLSLIPIVEGASVFTCSLVFLFCSFLTASALLADPDKSNEGYLVMQISIGLGFMFFVLFYVGGRTEKPQEPTDPQKPAQQASSKVADIVAEKADEGAQVLTSKDSGEEEEVQPVTEKTALFHLLMAFASLYYSMVLTNWGAPNIGGKVEWFTSKWVGYGILMAGQWLGILFFIWSLIAPRVCSNRDFS